MITLAFAAAFQTLASQLSEGTGGEDGLTFKVPEWLSPSFELASEHLLTVFRRVTSEVPETDREWVWVDLSRRVWVRVSECLLSGAAGRELATARRSHRLRVAGYDYQPGEGLWWLTEDGALQA